MSEFIAALPMYDWPETRAEVDAQWAAIRDSLRASGVDAPERLTRRNGDMPPVPGGIRDRGGEIIAPDPAGLPPDELDLKTLWLHPKLLLGQTCWGPMRETPLWAQVSVIGQPDYSDVTGGIEASYTSAIVMRGDDSDVGDSDAEPPEDGAPLLPLELLSGRRLAFNEPHSMSGLLALSADLSAAGSSIAIFADMIASGGHRASIAAVAEGQADVAAIDCRSWAMARRFEPPARNLRVVGWTSRRMGLPYICARDVDRQVQAVVRGALRPTMDANRLRRRLLGSGIARAVDLRGLDNAEIARIEATHGPLPASYRAILSLCGRAAGRLVDAGELQVYADQLDRLNADIAETLAEASADGEHLEQPPEGAFFISARYGEYQSCLIADGGEDSPVWTYNEDMTALSRTHDSVWDWFMGFVADAEYWIGLGRPEQGARRG